MTWKTRKKGTAKQIGKHFLIGGKRKLPPKIFARVSSGAQKVKTKGTEFVKILREEIASKPPISYGANYESIRESMCRKLKLSRKEFDEILGYMIQTGRLQNVWLFTGGTQAKIYHDNMKLAHPFDSIEESGEGIRYRSKAGGKRKVITLKQGRDVVNALKEYAKEHGLKFGDIRLVGGINIRGYSLHDIDIAVLPAWSDAVKKLLAAIREGKVKLPHGIKSENIDIFGSGEDEEAWVKESLEETIPFLAKAGDPLEAERLRKLRVKSLEEIRRLKKLTEAQKKWRGRGALERYGR